MGPATDLGLYVRLVREMRPYRLHIAAMFLLGVLAMPIALLMPLPLKIAVDSVVGDNPPPGVLQHVPGFSSHDDATVVLFAAVLFVVIELMRQLQLFGSLVLGAYTGERLLLGFREALFGQAQRLSLSYHDKVGTSDAVYRIQNDASALQWVAVYGVTPLLTAALTVAGMIYVTARIDMQLALVALAVVPLLLGISQVYRMRVRSGWKEAKQLESSALGVVQEVLTGLRVVKAFAQEDREQERFVDVAGAGTSARIRLTALEGCYRLLVGLTIGIGTATVLYIGIGQVNAGTLELGSLLLILGYLAQLYLPLQTVSQSVGALQSALASAERAFAVLDLEPDVPERPHARPLVRARGHVKFQNVSFAFDKGRPVLKDMSFDVPPGTRLGISGETGAGKTTLISLLTRFYDPTAGRILLDDVDLRDYNLGDLRHQFAIVLQEPVLFSTTVAENISYARPQASNADIVRAAFDANAHDFIRKLPDGYHTVVGERGMTLSGGERQRIALARAFLKNAPILVLDEPTSSVDNTTEAVIVEAMQRLVNGRTTFMIAHRLGTLEGCDARLEVVDGRVTGVAYGGEARNGGERRSEEPAAHPIRG
jgi:ATP-binding cassette, subfamily B, bacterial